MPQRLLEQNVGEGEVIDERDSLIEQQQDLIYTLKQQLSGLRNETEMLKRDNARAIGKLRHVLSPLYSALQNVFGEMDAMGGTDVTITDSDASPKARAVWDSWKQKLGGKQAEFIQMLLEHGPMTFVQLKVTTHSGQSTVSEILRKLRDLGLINKTPDGKYTLKQL